MCFAQPVAQKTPGTPADYPVAQNYGQVTSNYVTSDGVVHGDGHTIAQQNGEKNAWGYVPDPNWDKRPPAPAAPVYKNRVGARIARM